MKLNYNTFKEINKDPNENGSGNDFIDNYLKTLSKIESGNNPNAKAKTSSAAGLYQFTESTWNSMVRKMNLPYSSNDRYDPIKANKVVKQFTSDNFNYISKNIKPQEQITYTDMYMAHFLGNGGASTFLKALKSDSNTIASNILPNAARANKNVFYHKDGTPKTVGEVYNNFNKKFGNNSNNYISNNSNSNTNINIKDLPNLEQISRFENLKNRPVDYAPIIR